MSDFYGPGAELAPLIPATLFIIIWFAYFGLIIVMSLANTALIVVALVSIYRHRTSMSGTDVALWIAITLLGALAGAICWFVIGRRKVREEREVVSPVNEGSTSSPMTG